MDHPKPSEPPAPPKPVGRAARRAGEQVGNAPHATIERCRTRDGVFDRHRASDFDSQDIADAVAVANVGGAARRK